MHIELSKDEYEVLDSILTHINPKHTFQVGDLHVIHILNPRYNGTNKKKDLPPYNSVFSKLIRNNVYVNISAWLIERGFAKAVRENNSDYLLLTELGEILWNFEHLAWYDKAIPSSNEQQIILRVTELIKVLPKYGVFSVYKDPPTGWVIPRITEEEMSEGMPEHLVRLMNEKARVRKWYTEWLETEEVYKYLVKNGYILEREDVPTTNRFYRNKELTDKGRELKECGSLTAYENYITEKEKENKRKEELEDILLENHVYLTSDQRKTDRKYRQYTLLIAVVGLVAAVAIPLLQSYLSDDYIFREELRNEVRREMQLQAAEKAAQDTSKNDDTSNVVSISSHKEGVNQKSSDSTAALRKSGE